MDVQVPGSSTQSSRRSAPTSISETDLGGVVGGGVVVLEGVVVEAVDDGVVDIGTSCVELPLVDPHAANKRPAPTIAVQRSGFCLIIERPSDDVTLSTIRRSSLESLASGQIDKSSENRRISRGIDD